jgi:hypothetical protein
MVGMSVSAMDHEELESENHRLKKLISEKELHIDAQKREKNTQSSPTSLSGERFSVKKEQ